ncbi:MAG: ABC transporter substrate-binding protein [Planctomycetota bacterium]
MKRPFLFLTFTSSEIMRHRLLFFVLLASSLLLFGSNASAQKPFAQLVGPVSFGPVKPSAMTEIPFITWGGDAATFHANGGLSTRPGSIFQKQGLKVRLTPGDDFIGQVRNYVSGKSPFLRGTMRMLGQASEVIGKDSRTKPVVILQLSWSAGDHIIAREGIRQLNDLKGKKIACQQGGPHVGLLYDSLSAANLTKDDVEIVWTNDLTGPNGAAEKFRKDTSIDACCVITPDLFGLTGGFDSVGSGAEGTVKGAHVINSTQQMSRSIADVYAVRKDYFDKNRDQVEKFVAGYLAATKEVVTLRNNFESSQTMSPKYRQLLNQSKQIFGDEVIPTIEVDGHGLLLDCTFVGLPGQIAFFQQSGNLSGFQPKTTAALDLATGWGYAKNRFGFEPPKWDYKKLAKAAGVEYSVPQAKQRFAEGAESEAMFFGDELDSNTIVSFTINFEPNQMEFSADRYGTEFARALQAASTFGNARVVIRGHADPTKTLREMLQVGMKKGIIRQTGRRGSYSYFLNGRPLDVTQVAELVKLIESGQFSGGTPDPQRTMQAGLNLSKKRADAVKEALFQFAQQQNVDLDLSQIAPVGAGISDPIIPKPRSIQEAKENMRVEFRIVRVDAEALTTDDFDF